MRRNKRNYIEKLKDIDGKWLTDPKRVCGVARNYFHSLFKVDGNSNFVEVINQISRCTNSDINHALVDRFLEKEIIEAFNEMDLNKAPGLDGLSGLFYKENWGIVGADVVHFCGEVLNDPKRIGDFNETIIVLIPKVEDPQDITQYRPISLCRVIYKINSKVFTNRLKKFFRGALA